jgi:hypothetical protein
MTSENSEKPIGWLYDEATYHENDLRGRQWKCDIFSRQKPYEANGMIRNLRPLALVDGQYTFARIQGRY